MSWLGQVADLAVHDTPTSETGCRRLTTDPKAGDWTHIVERPTALAKPGIE